MKKTITKKLKYEIFKRDGFTCQYCGKMAPDVILEIDYINPVANNDDNNISNIITSCIECNSKKGIGKSTKLEEIKKQQEMLKEMNNRREQLEMLIDWKKEIDSIDNAMVDKIEEVLSITNSKFSNYGRENCKKLIKKYGFEEVYESAKISLSQYFVENDEKSINKTFDYIQRICIVRAKQKNNPTFYKINYLCKIAKNRLYYVNDIELKKYLNKNYEEGDYEIIKDILCSVKNWTELKNELLDYYGDEL